MSYTCPVCGATSHHPRDEEFGYCARCEAFTGEGTERYAYLRAVMLSEAPLRHTAQQVVEAILVDLAELDEDDPLPDWAGEDGSSFFPGSMSVGELRGRARVMLEELARR
jgi:hypothetical protein